MANIISISVNGSVKAHVKTYVETCSASVFHIVIVSMFFTDSTSFLVTDLSLSTHM